MFGQTGGAYLGYYSYMVYVLPGLILALYAQSKITRNYAKYSKIRNSRSLTGAEVARIILDRNGLSDVTIRRINGTLTDHYDPRDKSLSLSQNVYDGESIASAAVAAHEVGHAIQDKESYRPLVLRQTLAPAAQIGSNFAITLVILGMFVSEILINVGIAMFIVAVLFTIITLPVEVDASRRAKLQLADNIMTEQELDGARDVLSAAALTYLASMITAIGNLLRILSIARSRRD
ncbi:MULTISPECIES: zinc metallopeptidase [Peptoniphilus]|uniref:Putative neutral zinc metallopeptidase n=1 Tax=Peptoniphilus duerdenii ATCC BAA-1640 TaxID=862517 RepID=E0NP20_9FIRM|nr:MULTISPECIES: zinc metallopeptidase [Peptoniphilus]EFM24488.1 putative neutral zinc metallopeptidase [Peptoniphilus duerdenii ATCC BAA-1640]ERT63565.1 putative neutral zinc metallopeptidase [Peptoniphilus sp. BV3AC2]